MRQNFGRNYWTKVKANVNCCRYWSVQQKLTLKYMKILIFKA